MIPNERDFPMRLTFRIFPVLPLAAALALPLMLGGCRHHDHRDHEDEGQQAQPAESQAPNTDPYLQWERETHRQHEELAQRSAEERKQYEEWQRNHNRPDQPDRR